ncbi:MAG: hypothetical protein Q9174_002420 [Haloplaca sp. 1 TL-2023]
MPDQGFMLNLLVPRPDVKNVKTALEAYGFYDDEAKIKLYYPAEEQDSSLGAAQRPAETPETRSHDEPSGSSIMNRGRNNYINPYPFNPVQKFSVPTNVEVLSFEGKFEPQGGEITLARESLLIEIGFPDRVDIEADLDYRSRPNKFFCGLKSPLAQAVREWLKALPPSIYAQLPVDIDSLLNGCRWAYTMCTPMLLLPPTFLSKEPWPHLLAGLLRPHLTALYEGICKRLAVTHIAISGQIPALISDTSQCSRAPEPDPKLSPLSTECSRAPYNEGSESNSQYSPKDLMPLLKDVGSELNILRSPANFTPIYGDFGKPGVPPRAQNLRDAFWVSTVQNRITQSWAPLHTMFSRGNIKEKARLLSLRSVTDLSYKRFTAVDLYAGIGYFTFSYAKIGGRDCKVLCWELNRWSIEGLKRGAHYNGWLTRILENWNEKDRLLEDRYNELGSPKKIDERILVFHESNTCATRAVNALRHRIPPVRHVNCGYLPSSRDSWSTAFNVLDKDLGGWIHAHENVPVDDIERRKAEIVETFTDLAKSYRTRLDWRTIFTIECEHVERVKTYAPGIIHCVFDIAICMREVLVPVAEPHHDCNGDVEDRVGDSVVNREALARDIPEANPT